MRIDQLSADEFMLAVADLADAVVDLKDNDGIRELAASLMEFRGSLAEVPEEERKGKTAEFAVTAILKAVPKLCRESGDSVYRILAALDGISLEEYKEAFTPRKLVADVKGAVLFALDNPEVKDFFTQQ